MQERRFEIISVDFDCAGSHKVCAAEIAISKASFYRVPGVRVHVRT